MRPRGGLGDRGDRPLGAEQCAGGAGRDEDVREFKHGQPDWLDIGFAITDIDLIVGGVLLTLLQFWVLRRTRAGAPGGWPAELATVLPWIVLGGLVAAIVLMAGKPVG